MRYNKQEIKKLAVLGLLIQVSDLLFAQSRSAVLGAPLFNVYSQSPSCRTSTLLHISRNFYEFLHTISHFFVHFMHQRPMGLK